MCNWETLTVKIRLLCASLDQLAPPIQDITFNGSASFNGNADHEIISMLGHHINSNQVEWGQPMCMDKPQLSFQCVLFGKRIDPSPPRHTDTSSSNRRTPPCHKVKEKCHRIAHARRSYWKGKWSCGNKGHNILHLKASFNWRQAFVELWDSLEAN